MITRPSDVTPELKERILTMAFARSEQAGDCVLWRGSTVDGYGVLHIANTTYKAHRLLAFVFVEGWFEGAVIRHRCNNKLCINDKHLRWGTRQENAIDVREAGGNRKSRNQGAANGMAKLTEHDIQQIRTLLARGAPQKLIARHFSVAQSVISGINTGKRWSPNG